jgi:DNA-binding response OmpR family regulator
VRVGPLEVDTSTRTARVQDRALDLTPREFSLLHYLALRVGRPVSRAELEEHLYDERSQVFSNTIDVAVSSIRAKLQEAGAPPLIHTRRKVGYVLAETVI